MDPKVRKLLFEPLVSGSPRLIVPDFSIETPDGPMVAPALLTCADGNKFEFTAHFNLARVPGGLNNQQKQVLGADDRIQVTGHIEGDSRFVASAFPSFRSTEQSWGTSSVEVWADRIELVPGDSDLCSNAEIQALLGLTPEPEKSSVTDFQAHIIFHGPKLRLRDSRSEITRNNDFLGETTSFNFDTHRFCDDGWEGALIQSGDELHLHIRSVISTTPVSDPIDLVNRICEAIAFTHGFHPWPAYREVRINHRVKERWISPRLNLRQTYLAPVSESLAATLRTGGDPALRTIIPVITKGLGNLNRQEQDRVDILLWNVRSTALGDLPGSTKLLILCAALDGLMKLIGGDKGGTGKVWRNANERLGFSWEKWTHSIFELWGRHRHDLSHGRLWLPNDAPSAEFFSDYPKLGCAFMTILAAFCGYNGPIVVDPFQLK